MKGQKVSTLYKLIGNRVVGRVTVTTLIESSTDDTKLWHMRLGHIGECGVLELHEKFIEGAANMQARLLRVLCVLEVA